MNREVQDGPAASDPFAKALAELRGRRYVDVTVDTQFNGAWLILAVLLAAVGLAARIPYLLAASAILAVVPAVGWLWSLFALYGVAYSRKLSETRAFLGETVALTLEVRNRKFLPLTWLRVTDLFPATLPLDESGTGVDSRPAASLVQINPSTNLGELTSFWSASVFSRTTRAYTIRCTKRGYHAFGPATLRTGDPFGFFDRSAVLPGVQRLIVYPRLYPAETLGLPAKNPFGDRLAATPLVSDPLRNAGIRPWQPQDPLKRVHWKATARHRELLSRLYEPSQEIQILIFLNVATMERHWLGHLPELMERAVSVAGSLAAVCAEERLPVGLIANGVLPNSDQPLRLLPGRSPEQIVRILELLAAVTPFASDPIERLLMQESPRLPWGATLLVVSALTHNGLLAAINDLARAGRRVALFSLASQPPSAGALVPGVAVYHLPELRDGAIAPAPSQR